jgi:hypothetical protein
VQTQIGDQLAKALLAGQVRDGDTVTVDHTLGADALTLVPHHTASTDAADDTARDDTPDDTGEDTAGDSLAGSAASGGRS